MRMTMLAIAFLSFSGAASAASLQPAGNMPILNPNGDVQAVCPPISRYEAMRRGGKLPPSYLDELPAADLYKAVYRRIDGCIAPVIARYGIGASAPSKRDR